MLRVQQMPHGLNTRLLQLPAQFIGQFSKQLGFIESRNVVHRIRDEPRNRDDEFRGTNNKSAHGRIEFKPGALAHIDARNGQDVRQGVQRTRRGARCSTQLHRQPGTRS